MSDYYCHRCASSALQFTTPNSITSLSGTSYQFEKFIKHTAPSSSSLSGMNSVFDSPDYESYKGHIIATAASGWVEQDYQGRLNFTWYAGQRTGIQYQNGVFIAPTDGVKVVLSNNPNAIHAFPIPHSTTLGSVKCKNCGASQPY